MFIKNKIGPRTPNDDRSDSLNPNNDSYQDQLDNNADVQNPDHENYDANYNSNNK